MAAADFITKQCSRCKLQVPTSHFSPDKRSTDGLQPACMPCCRAAKKVARDANLQKARERERAYYAEHTDLVLAINARSRVKHHESVKAHKRKAYQAIKDDPAFKARIKQRAAGQKDQKFRYDRAYRVRRQEHLDAIGKAWRAKNPEKIKTIKQAYVARRRAQVKAGDSTADIHAWRMAAVKKCYWCGAACPNDYHTDHYQPLAKGGRHIVANLVIACPKCNLTKNARDPYEFANTVGRLF